MTMGSSAAVWRDYAPAAEPETGSRRLYAGRRLARKQASSRLIPAQHHSPVSTSSEHFRHLNGGSPVFAFLSPTLRPICRASATSFVIARDTAFTFKGKRHRRQGDRQGTRRTLRAARLQSSAIGTRVRVDARLHRRRNRRASLGRPVRGGRGTGPLQAPRSGWSRRLANELSYPDSSGRKRKREPTPRNPDVIGTASSRSSSSLGKSVPWPPLRMSRTAASGASRSSFCRTYGNASQTWSAE